jgi:hypothetical protein
VAVMPLPDFTSACALPPSRSSPFSAKTDFAYAPAGEARPAFAKPVPQVAIDYPYRFGGRSKVGSLEPSEACGASVGGSFHPGCIFFIMAVPVPAIWLARRRWVSRSLSSGRPLRAGPVGSTHLCAAIPAAGSRNDARPGHEAKQQHNAQLRREYRSVLGLSRPVQAGASHS